MEQHIPGKGKATASLVLGIISLVVAWFGWGALIGIGTAIAGLILGSQAKKELPEGYPNGTAKAGVICAIIGLVLSGIVFVACTLCVGGLAVAEASGALY